MGATAKLLDRLQRVKRVRPGAYMAACPCCQSRRGRPISITEGANTTCLVHAFCGCATHDVLASVGLSLADLFDRPLAHFLPPVRHGINPRELLELIGHEVTVAAILATDAGIRPLTHDEHARLVQAAARIGKAQAMTDGR